MKTPNCFRRLLACMVLVLAAHPTAHAAVGARVLVQVWSPLTPKQQSVQVVVNDASAVSDQVQKAWTEARPRVCAALLGAMGKGKAAGGQTLYDLKCLLDERPALSVTSASAKALAASLAIGGYVEATSTTPTALGSYADPRFSLAIKAHLQLTLSVQPNPDQTLRVNAAKFSLSDATIDSHNFSGDVLKFIADDLLPFFGGPQFRQLAEGAINAVEVDTRGSFNAALVPINAKLRGPSGQVRVAVWGKPDSIVVAFGPRALTPPTGGTMFGALRWDAGKVLAPGSCGSFSISATVQTGPAPLRDPNGYFESGDAPMLKVGDFQPMPAAKPDECRYRLSGLAQGWPNEVLARSSIGAGKAAGNSLYRVNYAVTGDGWDGHTVVPRPSAERNYLVRGTASGEAGLNAAAATKRRLLSPADPVVNPGSAVVSPALKAKTPYVMQKKADAVSLNPQPLPPSALTPAQVPSALR
jgi:hypothetical protein